MGNESSNYSNEVQGISQVAKGTFIKGKVISKEDLRVDGNFEGDLEVIGKLIIGESGKLKGNMIAKDIVLFGQLEAQKVTTKTITMKSTSSLQGEVYTSNLIIDSGAKFNGKCNMNKPA